MSRPYTYLVMPIEALQSQVGYTASAMLLEYQHMLETDSRRDTERMQAVLHAVQELCLEHGIALDQVAEVTYTEGGIRFMDSAGSLLGTIVPVSNKDQ